jgi:quinol-cytochrome oxidoreductase complex cytochrome b subunit
VLYSVIILGIVLLLSIFWRRDAGPAAQLLSISPFYGSKGGPGSLGITPTFPISWTHGMNRFVKVAFDLEPDIWGTVIGMFVMLATLIAVPFVDRQPDTPRGWQQAFNLRERGWAFGLIGLFWLALIVGVVFNAVTPVG